MSQVLGCYKKLYADEAQVNLVWLHLVEGRVTLIMCAKLKTMAVVARSHEVERQMKSGKEWPETDGGCTKMEKLVKGKVGAIAKVMITTTMIMVVAGVTMSEGR